MSDLISRQAAADELIAMQEHIESRMSVVGTTAYEMAIEALREPEIIRCKDCRWWEKYGDNIGYCHAAKHGHISRHWEISIMRTYESDFFCADAERRQDG